MISKLNKGISINAWFLFQEINKVCNPVNSISCIQYKLILLICAPNDLESHKKCQNYWKKIKYWRNIPKNLVWSSSFDHLMLYGLFMRIKIHISICFSIRIFYLYLNMQFWSSRNLSWRKSEEFNNQFPISKIIVFLNYHKVKISKMEYYNLSNHQQIKNCK